MTSRAFKFASIAVFIIFSSMMYGSVRAAPTLTSDPYPASVVQPDNATFTINGAAPISCTLPSVTGGVQPTCDLASITTPGTYTLVMTVTKAAGCAGNECWPAGSASSAPFAYVRRSVGVSAPAALKVAP